MLPLHLRMHDLCVVKAKYAVVALSGGNLRQVTAKGTLPWDLMWSSDGQHIIFNSTRSGLSRVWGIPAAGGAIELETVYPGTGSLSCDGRRLAYVDARRFFQGLVLISRVALSSAGGQVVSQSRIIISDRENNAPQRPPMESKSYSSPVAREDTRYGEAMRMAITRCR